MSSNDNVDKVYPEVYILGSLFKISGMFPRRHDSSVKFPIEIVRMRLFVSMTREADEGIFTKYAYSGHTSSAAFLGNLN